MSFSKRLCTCALVFAFALTGSAYAALPAAETGELVTNGSFEQLGEDGAPAGWTVNAAAEWTSVLKTDGATAGAPGGGANYINLPAKGLQAAYAVEVEAETRYEINFYYSSDKNNRNLLTVQHLNSSKSIVKEEPLTLPNTGGEWSRFSTVVKAADSTLQIVLHHAASGSDDPLLRFDMLSVRVVTNLLADGSFEGGSNSADWTEKPDTNSTVVYVSEGAEDGDTCVQITGKASEGYVTQKVLENGPYIRYRLSFSFKTDLASEGAYPYVSLPSINSNGAQTGNTLTYDDAEEWTKAGTKNWQKYSCLFSFDTDADSDGVTISLRGAGSGKVVYYDNVKLEHAESAALDETGEFAAAFTAGETLTASWQYVGESGTGAVLYAALYEKDSTGMKLIGISVGSGTVAEAAGAEIVETEIAIPAVLSPEKTYALKMLGWGSDMRPNTKTYTITGKTEEEQQNG